MFSIEPCSFHFPMNLGDLDVISAARKL